jgi:hypothetical protein
MKDSEKQLENSYGFYVPAALYTPEFGGKGCIKMEKMLGCTRFHNNI